MELSTFIRQLRMSKGMNQSEFAKLLNVSRTSVAGYETKHTTPSAEVLILAIKFAAPDIYKQMEKMASKAKESYERKKLERIDTLKSQIARLEERYK